MSNSSQNPSSTSESVQGQNSEDKDGTEMNACPQRHAEYYSTTMIVLKIENTLYRVDLKLLRLFQVFRDMFESATQFNTDKSEGLTDSNPIQLQGVTNFEFESLLRIFEPAHFYETAPAVGLDQWSAILHLSTMWSYDKLREHAIGEVEKLIPPPVESILLSRKCNVEKWLKPAYTQLCKRLEPITAEEGLLLGIHLFADLCHLRERMTTIGCDPSRSSVLCRSCGYQNSTSRCYSCSRSCMHRSTCASCGQPLVKNGFSNDTDLDTAINNLMATRSG